MAKKKKSGITVKKVRKNGINILVVPKNATPRQICRAYKKQFTAADLVKCLEELEKPMMPTEQLLAEMEQIQREESANRKRK